MSIFNVNNFVKEPSSGDVEIYFVDINGKIVLSVDPYSSTFYVKSTYVYIISDGQVLINNAIQFSTEEEAYQALVKLNDIKKYFVENVENISYSKTQSDANFVSGLTYGIHTGDTSIHFTKNSILLDDLGDVNTGGTQQGYYLIYSASTWIGTQDSTDLSNYYNKQQVYNTGQTYSKTEINNNFLSLSGGTLTGNLSIINSTIVTNSSATFSFLKIDTNEVGIPVVQVGNVNPFYMSMNWPTLSYNAYWNYGWKFGAGSSSQYGAFHSIDPNSGTFDFYISSDTGNTDEVMPLNRVFTLYPNKDVYAYGNLYSTTFFGNLDWSYITSKPVLNDFSGVSFYTFGLHTGATNPHGTSFTELTYTAHTHNWSNINNTPNTIAGYGIVDAYTQTQIETILLTYTELEPFQDHTGDTSIHYIKSDIFLGELGNVNTGGTQQGYYLSYSSGTWIGIPDSTDLSNYYNKQQVYNTGETYTQTQTNNNFVSASTFGLHTGSTNPHSTTLSSLTDVSFTNIQEEQMIVYSGGTWVNIANSTDLLSAGFKNNEDAWIDNTDGSITLPYSKISLFPNDDGSGYLQNFYVNSGKSGVDFPDLLNYNTNYVVVKYNNGNPIYDIILDDSIINDTTIIRYLNVYRDDNTLHILEFGSNGNALANKINSRLIATDQLRRESGLGLTTSGTGTASIGDALIIENGVVWNGANKLSVDYCISTSADTIVFLLYQSGSSSNWKDIEGLSGFNNTQYNDYTLSNPLQNLGTSGYGINWIYRGIEDQKHIYIILGTTAYTNSVDAKNAAGPITLPEIITSHALLVGRIITKYQVSTAQDISTAFATVFVGAAVTNHNDLLGIQGGLPGQYLHLSTSQHTNLTTNVDAGLLHHHDARYYNTGLTYTKTEVNTFISGLTNSLTAHTSLTGISNPHETSFFDLTTTAHTHDERYYLKTEIYNTSEANNNFLSANTSFYTQSQSNNNFVSATTFNSHTGNTNNPHNVTTVQISAYTINQSNNNFLSANTSYYTQTQSNNNFLSANTSYYTQAQSNTNFVSAITFNSHTGDTTIHFTKNSILLGELNNVNTGGTLQGYYLSYSSGTWIGIADSTDLSNYYTKQQVYNTGETYTKTEVNTFISGLTNSLTAHTSLTGISNPHETSFFDLTSTAHTHLKLDISNFVENDYVHVTGTENVSGDKRFMDSIVIAGNLTVSGITTFINTQNLSVKDNIITINSGETGSGVTLRYAGIEVDRGVYPKYIFIYDENTQNFRVGVTGQTQAVATREDIPSSSGIAYWNYSSNRFDTNSNIKIVGNDIVTTGLVDGVDISLLNSDFITHTGQTNPHGTSFTALTYTAHTHDERYYTISQSNSNFVSATTFNSHTSDTSIHYTKNSILLGDLNNVNTGGTQQGYYLSYSSGTWVGIQDSTDLSNYYNKQQVYNTGQTYTKTETNTLYSALTYILTAHTSLTGSSNPHLTSFVDLTSTAHTHLWTNIDNRFSYTNLSSTTNLDVFDGNSFDGCNWLYTIKDGNNLRSGNVISVWNLSNSSVTNTDYSTDDLGVTSGVSFNVGLIGNYVELDAYVFSGNWKINLRRLSI